MTEDQKDFKRKTPDKPKEKEPGFNAVEQWDERHPANVLPVVAAVGPYEIMMKAIDKGSGKEVLEQIQAMFEFQQQVDAVEAKKAYVSAMSAFKTGAPDIGKDQTVEYEVGNKKTTYKHASLANVTKTINTALGTHGLSAAWQTKQNNGDITVICTITHESGHSENTELTAKPDTTGSKNAIQAIGSTISYLERYTLLALTGLATSDMDNDAQGEPEVVEIITTDQVIVIDELIAETSAPEKFILKTIGAESVETIPKSEYKQVLTILNKRKSEMRQPGE